MINQCQNAFRGNYLQRYNPMIGPSLLKARPKMQSQASAATSTMNKSSETAEQCPLFWPGGAVQAGKAEGGEESGQTER